MDNLCYLCRMCLSYIRFCFHVCFTDRSKTVLLVMIICVICVLCVFASASFYCCFVVTCWERADILALVCDF